jgi:crotonobetainyl-CoA:carnitine CoA-transferase CaiB-like acyl-CoA transferase
LRKGAIYEPLFWVLGPQLSIYDRLGILPQRTGNAAPLAAPRTACQASDGRWLGLTGTTQSIAVRVMRIVGRRPDLIDEPWFVDHTGRLEQADELDEAIQAWINGHTTEEVLAAFEEQEGVIPPIYSMAEIVEDPSTAGGTVSYGYRLIVPQECVADWAPGWHHANLFDIQAKYGQVVRVAEVLEYLPKGSVEEAAE